MLHRILKTKQDAVKRTEQTDNHAPLCFVPIPLGGNSDTLALLP